MNIHHLFRKIKWPGSPAGAGEPGETLSYEIDESSGEVHLGAKIWLNRLWSSLVVIFIGLLGFGLGRISAPEREAIRIEYDPSLSNLQGEMRPVTRETPSVTSASGVVASSKGNKYHYSHCPGAKQISEANKIVFQSSLEAEKAGYTLASNCRPR